ncbi:MAG: choice-of-anchor A family protein [Phycisphaerae bacterium]|jgi:choice-of-anchor A domain-containing protein|nr:choice-of-anchor A family protein [Phycisphaerae bacterium]
MKRTLALTIAVMLIWAGTARADLLDSPMGYFNVYSLGDIGSVSSAYHSDFQGAAGAAGDVHFAQFSLADVAASSGYALHVGGSARLGGGSYYGSVEAGGNVELGFLDIAGSVLSGGDVSNFGGGTVSGDVVAAGSVSLSQQMTVFGDRLSGVPYSPTVDHAAMSEFFRTTSDSIGAMSATTVVTNRWGMLGINAQSGINVVSLDGATLRNAWGLNITGPDDAVVYVNVPNETVSLNWTGWEYHGGISTDDVLLNMPNATRLSLSSANAVNILAPEAETYFGAGLIEGVLVVGDLQGGGQVNIGGFDHASVPEPATMVLLGGLGAVILRRRRRGR